MTVEDRALLAQIDIARKRYLHSLELMAEVECLRMLLDAGGLDARAAKAMVADLWFAIGEHRRGSLANVREPSRVFS